MSYQKVTVPRNRDNQFSGRHDDTLRLHENEQGHWIIVDDHGGDTVLVIYNLTDHQLASLHAAIGRRLGLAPEVTLEHVRRMHSHLSEIVARDDARKGEASRWQSPFSG